MSSMEEAPETTAAVAPRPRAAVIGAGMAGLGTAWALRQYTNCEVVVFERHGNVGGLWLFDDPLTGNKTSMYEDLRVNVPLQMMPFLAYKQLPDSFKPEETHFPYRPVFQEYLEIAAQEMGVTEVTQFGTSVKKVEKQDKTWNVVVEKGGVERSEVFDHVIVCNGHHAARLIPPEFKEAFPLLGKNPRFLHSADYRSAAAFQGCKNVLIVGAASSGMDISLQIAEVAEKVTMLVRPTSKMLEIPIGDKVEVITELADASQFDGAVLCTGYAVHLPFLPRELRDTSKLLLHTFPKGDSASNLFFVGLPQRVPTAPMYQLQGMVVAGVIAGKITLPEKSDFCPKRFASDETQDLPEEACQIGDYEFYLEEKLRLRHEIEDKVELPGLWNALCDLVSQMDSDEAARLKNNGKVMIEIYAEALRRRAAGGLGNECTYRNDRLLLEWNEDGTAKIEWY